MYFKCPLTIQDFFSAFYKDRKEQSFGIPLHDYLINKEEDNIFGFKLLREAIERYEKNLIKQPAVSKCDIPLFRENQLRLIGADLIPFVLSLYQEDSSYQPTGPCIILYFELEDLIDYCIDENLPIVHCKYDTKENLQLLGSQVEHEYSKIFFDNEYTGFASDSQFVPLLYKTLIEMNSPEKREENEWRVSMLESPENVEFVSEGDTIQAIRRLYLPFSFVKQIELYPDYKENKALYTTIITLLKNIHLSPERLLVGLIE